MNATISSAIAPTNQASLPNAATISQVTPVGLDVGNGAVKMTSSMAQILMESYVHYLSERATHANLGYVEYLSSDRPDLTGKQWIGGINNSAASGRSMKQPFFSTSYAPRGGESTLDEIEGDQLANATRHEVLGELGVKV